MLDLSVCFFKQKTAYEMRISDWSSDVCSSDLFIAPPGWLCTDNAAMIAWAGAERFQHGLIDGLDAVARARWPLDPDAPPARGAGVKDRKSTRLNSSH